MIRHIHSKTSLAAAILLVGTLPGKKAVSENEADAAPSYDRQVTLVYTVNNFGYTETCG